MSTPRAGVLVAGLACATLLAGCTGGGDDGRDGAPTGGSRASSSPTGEPRYPSVAPTGTTPAAPLATRTGPEGSIFELDRIRRLDPARVVVEGRLTQSGRERVIGWNEPGFSGIAVEGRREFADLTLTRTGDPGTYLVVRNPDRFCQCSDLTRITPQTGAVPVYAVLSAPPENDGISLTVALIGTLDGLSITP